MSDWPEAPQGDFAFPWVAPQLNAMCPGMSLRDYFAGQALIGFITVNAPSKLDDPAPAFAWAAYHVADAMLAERAKAVLP